MTETDSAPVDTPKATGKPPGKTPGETRKGRPENLIRYPKGHLPEHLRARLEAPKLSKRALMQDIREVLLSKDGKRQRELAEAIVANAIEGNAACLGFLAERLAPLEHGQGGGRVVFEGIKLEVVGGADGARTSIALVRGQESHGEGMPLEESSTTSLAGVPVVQDSAVNLEE
jgi:hypothetical protein